MLKDTRAMSRESDRMHEQIMLKIVKLKGVLCDPEASVDDKAGAKACLLKLKTELNGKKEDGCDN